MQDHPEFYKQVSVISVPIRFEEGVGLYLCEAFAAGRPAVEPITGSFPEIVGEAGILYHPDTPDALADALEKIVTDKELYTQKATEARRLSKTRYNHTAVAAELEKLYQKLQNEKRVPC